MKNQKGIIHLFVIIILALAVVGGIGYYAYKNGQIKSIPQGNLSPTPATDETANWKTYRNDKLGFELKHPSDFRDWEVWGSGYSDRLPITISFHKKYDENSFDGGGLFITITDRSEYGKGDSVKTLDDYINNKRKMEKKVKINEHLIDNQKAFEIIYGDGKSMEHLFTEPDVYRGPIEYVVLKGNKFYIFEYHTDDTELMKIIDQILSTFRFLDNDEVNVPLQNLLNNPEQYSNKRICTEGYFYDAFETSALVKSFDEENKKLEEKPLIWVENETNENILIIIVDKKAVRKLRACGIFETKGGYGHLGSYPYVLKLQNFTTLDEVIYF